MTPFLLVFCLALPGFAAEIIAPVPAGSSRHGAPATEALPPALAAPYVQAEAALKAESGEGAQPSPDAIAARAEQLVGEQARAALAAGASDDRTRLQALAAEYSQWDRSRHLAKVIADALDAAAPEPETAVDAEALAEVRRELKDRTLVPPSLVQSHLARVYGGSMESGRAVHSGFIEPLRDPRAKRMMLALLSFVGEQPRLLRPVGYERARELLVAAANELSERFDPDGPRSLPAALGAFSARLAAERAQAPQVPQAPAPAARPEPEIPARGRPDPVAGARLGAAAESIDYFPGWPELDALYASLLRSGRMKLAKEANSRRANEEVYTIYLGSVEAGRLTIRYNAGRVERSVLFMLDGRMSTQGRADSSFDDAVRRLQAAGRPSRQPI